MRVTDECADIRWRIIHWQVEKRTSSLRLETRRTVHREAEGAAAANSIVPPVGDMTADECPAAVGAYANSGP